MLEVKPVEFLEIQRFFVDFQKRSHCFEMPPEKAECFGAYNNGKLAGYFVAVGYHNTVVEINQGYLRPGFRHKGYPAQFIQLFEVLCKQAGYQEIKLATQNRFKSYLKFGKMLGYKPEKLIFSKVI